MSMCQYSRLIQEIADQIREDLLEFGQVTDFIVNDSSTLNGSIKPPFLVGMELATAYDLLAKKLWKDDRELLLPAYQEKLVELGLGSKGPYQRILRKYAQDPNNLIWRESPGFPELEAFFR